MFNNPIKNVLKIIKKYNNIVIARHISPDPDAIASEIALRDIIKLNYPSKNVYAVGSSVSKFKYYGNLDRIENLDYSNTLLIALDVPNKERIDCPNISSFKEMIKIDHHPSEEEFNKYDWVNENASSTCELIIEFLLKNRLKFDTKIAENLYLGVVSDSERFLISYTSAKTFKLVSKLLEISKIDISKLYNYLYERTYEEIKFSGFISTNLQISENGLGYLIVEPDILKEYNVDCATPSNMINNFSNIKGMYVWIFATYDEKTKLYKVNIRSKGPIINDVASIYGGGGHKFASGARIEKKEDVLLLIEALDEECKKYKESLAIQNES